MNPERSPERGMMSSCRNVSPRTSLVLLIRWIIDDLRYPRSSRGPAQVYLHLDDRRALKIRAPEEDTSASDIVRKAPLVLLDIED